MTDSTQSGALGGGAYRVRLDVFEGPLDLLLHLIRRSKVDLFDIPIAIITEQYLGYLALMKELDLRVAGEFIVMAATLVHIKTQMLLPRPETAEEERGEQDPRMDLVSRLLQYQQYKEAATDLYEREIVQDHIWPRPEPLAESAGETLIEVSLFDLLSSLQEVINRAKDRIVIEVDRHRFSVNDKIAAITDRLAATDSIPFQDLFEEAGSREEIVVTFLALLEMIRLRMLRVLQKASFGQIWVFRRGDEEAG